MRRGGSETKEAPERGVALIVALLVVAILVAVTLQFTYTTSIDLKLVRNQSREARSYFAARGVVTLAMTHLREDLAADSGDDPVDTLHDPWSSLPEAGEEEEDPFSEPPGFQRSIGDISVEYRIVDEDGKVCVNNLIVEEVYIEEEKAEEGNKPPAQDDEKKPPQDPKDKEKEEPPTPEELGKERREKTREFIRDILIQSPFNFEMGDAETLVEAMAKGAPYSSITDLESIEGMTPEVLLGFEDEFGVYPGLVDFLTVYSMGQINLNTAPREVLIAILTPKYLGEAEFFADSIIEFRTPSLDEELPPEEPEESEEGKDPEEKDPGEEEEEGEDAQTQGGVFKKVGDLAKEIAGLEEVFGTPEGPPEELKKGKALRNQLTVRSRFFSVRVTTGDVAPKKEFSFVLKRGKTAGEPMPVLLWEEREIPPDEDEEVEFP